MTTVYSDKQLAREARRAIKDRAKQINQRLKYLCFKLILSRDHDPCLEATGYWFDGASTRFEHVNIAI